MTILGAFAWQASGRVVLPASFESLDEGTGFRRADIIFRRNGTIGLDTNADEDWWSEAPVTDIGDSYEVRCESIFSGGPTWDVQAAAVGTWIGITTDRTWAMFRTVMEGPGVDTITGTFEIRPNGGSVEATGNGTATAEIT